MFNQNTDTFVSQMLDWFRGRGRVVIVVHDNPDPDALAAAMALQHLLVMRLGKEPVIAFSGFIGRSENLAMANLLGVKLTPAELITFADFSAVCLVDCQPATGNTSLPRDVSVDLVIDHHPLREHTRNVRWADVREGYGATATILYEYLLKLEIPVNTRLATALFYAIKSETQDLGRDATSADRQAYAALFPLVNKNLLYRISYPRQPHEYYAAVAKALATAQRHGPLLISRLGEVVIPELIAEVADFLLPLETIETVLCCGRYRGDGYLSMRSWVDEPAAGTTLRNVIAGLGTAGGHDLMAGGRLEQGMFAPLSLDEAEDELIRRLLAALGLQHAPLSLLAVDTPQPIE